MSHFSRPEVETIIDSFLKTIEIKPLRFAVIGTSGVGKSSTVNALFNAHLAVSHTIACTKEFTILPVDLHLNAVTGPKRALLHVIDAPGLGESLRADPAYIEAYKSELPKCDVVLWLMAARNRGLALDQKYLQELYRYCPTVVFGINQVDLVEPRDWAVHLNLPSDQQAKNISEIELDRADKISEIIGTRPGIVSFSAATKYNLTNLFAALINALPSERQALYDLIKGFRLEDEFPCTPRIIPRNEPKIVEQSMSMTMRALWRDFLRLLGGRL